MFIEKTIFRRHVITPKFYVLVLQINYSLSKEYMRESVQKMWQLKYVEDSYCFY